MRTLGNSSFKRQHLAVFAMAAILLLAGCTGALDDDDDAPAADDMYVPEDADLLMEVDLQVVMSDEVDDLYTGINDIFVEHFDERLFDEDRDALLAEFEAETGLDYTDADSMLLFAEEPEDPTVEEEFGLVLDSAWEAADIVGVLEDEGHEHELIDYAGESDVLYEPTETPGFEDPVYIGVLPDGLMVMGSEQSVKGSLDVAYDGAPGVSGPIVDVLDAAPEGGFAVSFDAAALMEDEELPDEVPDDEFLPPEFEFEMFEEVQAFGMALYPDDGSIATQILIEAGSADNADDIVNVFEGALSMWVGELDENEPFEADLIDELESIEVDGDGALVTVSYSITVDDLLDYTEDYIWFLLMGMPGDLDSMASGPQAPATANVGESISTAWA